MIEYTVGPGLYPDGSLRLVVFADAETIHALAADLNARMLARETRGDRKALSALDLAELADRHGNTATVDDRNGRRWRYIGTVGAEHAWTHDDGSTATTTALHRDHSPLTEA